MSNPTINNIDETVAKTIATIEKRYAAWVLQPNRATEQVLLFVELTKALPEHNAYRADKRVEQRALQRLIDVCHRWVQHDVEWYLPQDTNLADAFFVKDWWTALVLAEEEHLLAALILMGVGDDAVGRVRTLASYAFSQWTGAKFIKPSPHQQREAATLLFGEAWALLYAEELGPSFKEIFRTIKHTLPPLVFKKDFCVPDTPIVTLPSDF